MGGKEGRKWGGLFKGQELGRGGGYCRGGCRIFDNFSFFVLGGLWVLGGEGGEGGKGGRGGNGVVLGVRMWSG